MFEKASSFFILQWGWKRAMSAFIAGALSALAMPPFDFFPIFFITFPILVWLLDGAAVDPIEGFISRILPSFMVGWWFGFGYFLAGLWWIGSALLVEADAFIWLLPIAVLGLPALLGIFWGLAAILASFFWREDWSRIVVLSVILGLAEYLRGTLFTGFSWNAIGYGAMTLPITMQSASVLGLYAMTTLTILVTAIPALFAPSSISQPRRLRAMLILGLVLVSAHVGFGYWRLQSNPTNYVEGKNLRIIQPAIPQHEKWLAEKESENFKIFIALSKENQGKFQNADEYNKNSAITHYIWPESAFPFLLTERRDALGAIAQMLPENSFLITGAARSEASVSNDNGSNTRAKIFNSVYVINHNGEIIGAADKFHLVPFGEYLPFADLARGMGLRQIAGRMGGFTAASGRTVLGAGNTNFLPLICYEIIFPNEIFTNTRKTKFADQRENSTDDSSRMGATWIANITNDAWFGVTTGPYQHARQAQIRGVEEGLPVVRSANTGISFVSDSYGRIVGKLGLETRAKLDARLPAPAEITLYHRFGNTIFWLLSLGLFGATILRRREQ